MSAGNGRREVVLEDHAAELAAMRDDLVMVPRRTAVVTVDMHRGHLDATEATFPVAADERERVLGATVRLLAFARSRGLPVVHVVLTLRRAESERMSPRYEPRRIVLSPEVPLTDARRRGTAHNLVGSIQAELMPELGPEPGDHVIDNKKSASAFLWTDLDHLLRVLGVDTLVLAGINTNTCVQCTAFDAANLGYRAVVVPECVASMYGRDLHEFALENIARCIGWVVGLEELESKLATPRPPPSTTTQPQETDRNTT